jgi:hypothetical protein
MTKPTNPAYWGRKMASIRHSRNDPGSPCEKCKKDCCPEFCRPKHDFERRRYRRERKKQDD